MGICWCGHTWWACLTDETEPPPWGVGTPPSTWGAPCLAHALYLGLSDTGFPSVSDAGAR